MAQAIPARMKLPAALVTATVAENPNPDGSVEIVLDSSAVALYVTLTTLAYGRFSDNAFLLGAGTTTILFFPFGPLDISTLRSSLRVEHLAEYLAPV